MRISVSRSKHSMRNEFSKESIQMAKNDRKTIIYISHSIMQD